MATKTSPDSTNHKTPSIRTSGTLKIKSYGCLRSAVFEGGTMTAIKTSRAGLPASLLVGLARHYHISRHQAYHLVGLKPATGDRKVRDKGRLTPEVSERLTRIAQIEAEAIDVLGDEPSAHRWLETPNPALGDERPLEIIDTGYGAEAVRRVLGAIRYGGAA